MKYEPEDRQSTNVKTIQKGGFSYSPPIDPIQQWYYEIGKPAPSIVPEIGPEAMLEHMLPAGHAGRFSRPSMGLTPQASTTAEWLRHMMEIIMPTQQAPAPIQQPQDLWQTEVRPQR